MFCGASSIANDTNRFSRDNSSTKDMICACRWSCDRCLCKFANSWPRSLFGYNLRFLGHPRFVNLKLRNHKLLWTLRDQPPRDRTYRYTVIDPTLWMASICGPEGVGIFSLCYRESTSSKWSRSISKQRWIISTHQQNNCPFPIHVIENDSICPDSAT